ncbi:MAG: DUF4345 domain-containing protein [Pseudomonadota bacterium]
MPLSRFQKITLGLSGITALVIGLSILFVPRTFYASYGITLDHNPNLLSELRAPGAGLASFGAIMLSGVWRAAFAPLAFKVALTVYLSFPAGRVVSLLADGVPSISILGALAVEVVIAGLLLGAFGWRSSFTPHSPHSTGY